MLPGWILTIALTAVSAPTRNVPVSTCLESRGRNYPINIISKAALEVRGLYPINFGQNLWTMRMIAPLPETRMWAFPMEKVEVFEVGEMWN
jgi:hypothetical protein